MDEPTAAGSITEWVKLVGATGIGGLIMAFFARFTFRKFAEEETASKRAAGETDIIEQLRAEVDRMAIINERLSTKVGELQDQLIQLRSENAELKGEIQALQLQIKTMRHQQERCATCPELPGA